MRTVPLLHRFAIWPELHTDRSEAEKAESSHTAWGACYGARINDPICAELVGAGRDLQRKTMKTAPVLEGTIGETGRFGPDGQDRRRRRRVKMTMPVHIWGGVGSTGALEDLAKPRDASPDGFLVA